MFTQIVLLLSLWNTLCLGVSPVHYSYEYKVDDKHTGDIKGASESREDDVTKGEYFLIEPDGTKRTVKYSVEGKHGGFSAIVTREGHGHSETYVYGKGEADHNMPDREDKDHFSSYNGYNHLIHEDGKTSENENGGYFTNTAYQGNQADSQLGQEAQELSGHQGFRKSAEQNNKHSNFGYRKEEQKISNDNMHQALGYSSHHRNENNNQELKNTYLVQKYSSPARHGYSNNDQESHLENQQYNYKGKEDYTEQELKSKLSKMQHQAQGKPGLHVYKLANTERNQYQNSQHNIQGNHEFQYKLIPNMYSMNDLMEQNMHYGQAKDFSSNYKHQSALGYQNQPNYQNKEYKNDQRYYYNTSPHMPLSMVYQVHGLYKSKDLRPNHYNSKIQNSQLVNGNNYHHNTQGYNFQNAEEENEHGNNRTRNENALSGSRNNINQIYEKFNINQEIPIHEEPVAQEYTGINAAHGQTHLYINSKYGYDRFNQLQNHQNMGASLINSHSNQQNDMSNHKSYGSSLKYGLGYGSMSHGQMATMGHQQGHEYEVAKSGEELSSHQYSMPTHNTNGQGYATSYQNFNSKRVSFYLKTNHIIPKTKY